MRILIAPDSFKHSLSAKEVADNLEAGLLQVLPDSIVTKIPVADGGEGTVQSLIDATNGKLVKVTASDPLMRKIDSFFGILGDNKTAVIEMAAASGIELLSEEEKDPWITSTYGTGELIVRALDHGCKKIIVGIGGSATNDGGAGMVQALGGSLRDEHGIELRPGGGQLGKLRKIDLGEMDPRLKSVEIMVASDVINPLTGEQGASLVYGPQKGGNELMVEKLDRKLGHFANIIQQQLGIDIEKHPGAGAAGGLGAGLIAFLQATLQPGFTVVSNTVSLETEIKLHDFVITGEGKMDRQTQYGKTPFGVAQLASKYGKPVIGVAGILGEGYEVLLEKGFSWLLPISEKQIPIQESIRKAPELLIETGARIGKLIKSA
jgi:glycerate kinase